MRPLRVGVWYHADMTSKTEQAVLALRDLPFDQQEEIADLIINAVQPTIQWDVTPRKADQL